jgi:hypothetical protein
MEQLQHRGDAREREGTAFGFEVDGDHCPSLLGVQGRFSLGFGNAV